MSADAASHVTAIVAAVHADVPAQLLNELLPWIVWIGVLGILAGATYYAVGAWLADAFARRPGQRLTITGWRLIALLPIPIFDWVNRDDRR
jgi:hypothetical protein